MKHVLKVFVYLLLAFPLHSARAEGLLEISPHEIQALHLVNESGQSWITLDWNPAQEPTPDHGPRTYALLAHALADGALTYGVFHMDPTQDKVRHFFAGYVISNVTTGMLQLVLPDTLEHRRLLSIILGFATGVAAGAAKEWLDAQGYGNPSLADAGATTLGAGAGTLTISLKWKIRHKRKKRRRL